MKRLQIGVSHFQIATRPHGKGYKATQKISFSPVFIELPESVEIPLDHPANEEAILRFARKLSERIEGKMEKGGFSELSVMPSPIGVLLGILECGFPLYFEGASWRLYNNMELMYWEEDGRGIIGIKEVKEGEEKRREKRENASLIPPPAFLSSAEEEGEELVGKLRRIFGGQRKESLFPVVRLLMGEQKEKHQRGFLKGLFEGFYGRDIPPLFLPLEAAEKIFTLELPSLISEDLLLRARAAVEGGLEELMEAGRRERERLEGQLEKMKEGVGK